MLFIAIGRAESVTSSVIGGAPDLLLEILSPGTRGIDEGRKGALYAASSIREFWLVDPRTRPMAVMTLTNGKFAQITQAGDVARSIILAGFAAKIAPLFADLS